MSAAEGSSVTLTGTGPALIVRTSTARLKNAPVCVNSHNLTREIAPFEDARLAQPVVVDEDHVSVIFRALMAAGPDAAASEEDRARVVLCRLLLGPVAVPCYCDEWDVDDYLTRCAYRCHGPALYVHRSRCRCVSSVGDPAVLTGNLCRGPGTVFTVIHDHHTTHVYRGLLSLAEWNQTLPDVFCPCTPFRSDRYVMAVLPKRYAIFLDYYPYFLVCLARYLTVPEMDDCVEGMTAHLGPQIAARVGTHYKILFGSNARLVKTQIAGRANYDLFLLELQKLSLSVSYRNPTTRDFFEVVFGAFHRDTGRVMLALRTPPRTTLVLDATEASGPPPAKRRRDQNWEPRRVFSITRLKRQVLYFDLRVRHTKTRRDDGRNVFVARRHVVVFAEGDVLWRNLFYIYYVWGPTAGEAAVTGLDLEDEDVEDDVEGSWGDGSGISGFAVSNRRVRRVSAKHGSKSSVAAESVAAVQPGVEPTVSDVGGGGGGGGGVSVAGVSVSAQRYVRVVDRLSLVRLRYREQQKRLLSGADGVGRCCCFDFDPLRGLVRHRAAIALINHGGVGVGVGVGGLNEMVSTAGFEQPDHRDAYAVRSVDDTLRGGQAGERGFETEGGSVVVRRVIGGREFSEMTAVSLNRVAVNAFNTNRVINLKATVARRPRLSVFPTPRNMTHSFVMYKHTFKETPFTVSTFVSNDVAYTHSLNVNIRGSYPEFLYALVVYRLYVNVAHFFLPAAVCNSNSSFDVHGLEDQGLVRSERNRVYWTTNFPCMISNTSSVNVGWFKAATAIVPKVSGIALESVLLKELGYVVAIDRLRLDYAVHRVFTELETRNCYQIPFLSKQFVLFVRIMLLRVFGIQYRATIDRLVFRAVRAGVFDYHKNTVAHAKIKHACALVGTRLANNVPKVLVRNRKVKVDYLGRNANLMTLCRHVDRSCVSGPRLAALLGALDCLEQLATDDGVRDALARVRLRLSDLHAGSVTTAATTSVVNSPTGDSVPSSPSSPSPQPT